ncbi:MAG: hypothetical protein BWX84_01975 [Verrucomicrobia bacterium ADurb.Bin118]|jgi:hypothetical protein|nr:MAG: hypothetical protein BWX84_01975 [Verrucomicrobia bacterium ADurb.Bin118]
MARAGPVSAISGLSALAWVAYRASMDLGREISTATA